MKTESLITRDGYKTAKLYGRYGMRYVAADEKERKLIEKELRKYKNVLSFLKLLLEQFKLAVRRRGTSLECWKERMKKAIKKFMTEKRAMLYTGSFTDKVTSAIDEASAMGII